METDRRCCFALSELENITWVAHSSSTLTAVMFFFIFTGWVKIYISVINDTYMATSEVDCPTLKVEACRICYVGTSLLFNFAVQWLLREHGLLRPFSPRSFYGMPPTDCWIPFPLDLVVHVTPAVLCFISCCTFVHIFFSCDELWSALPVVITLSAMISCLFFSPSLFLCELCVCGDGSTWTPAWNNIDKFHGRVLSLCQIDPAYVLGRRDP